MIILRRGAPQYPASLDDLHHPPDPIYALGDVALLDRSPERLVAIVGTRDASPYGLRVAEELARAFVVAGVGVVSGMARGIDSAAHRAALEAGGATIAVLGTGADVPYPAGNRALHEAIVAGGLVVSEFEPGTRAGPGCFPRRNRIIAALAQVTIVVEAPFKSGAVNTASQALDLGRTVAAVPGPIDVPRSAGCNLLLRDGAQFIASVEDALALFGELPPPAAAGPALGYQEGRVWEALAEGESSPEGLAYRLGLSVRQAMEIVSRLELLGLVYGNDAGMIAKRQLSTSGLVSRSGAESVGHDGGVEKLGR